MRVHSFVAAGGPDTPVVYKANVPLGKGPAFEVPDSALGYLELLAAQWRVVLLNTVYFVPEGGQPLPAPPPTGFQVRVLPVAKFETLWRAILLAEGESP